MAQSHSHLAHQGKKEALCYAARRVPTAQRCVTEISIEPREKIMRIMMLVLLIGGCAGTDTEDLATKVEALCPSGGDCCPSPIIIDIDGDGIELTAWTDGVRFELIPERRDTIVSWTKANSDDAWLVLDWNGDGLINDGAEMFGNITPQLEPPQGMERNGFLALVQLDNGDLVINEYDQVFADLRLWQDKNHDGVSQSEELHTLLEFGVTGLSLEYSTADSYIDKHGNSFKYQAPVFKAPGSTIGMTAWDVWLFGVTTKREQQTQGASKILAQSGDECYIAPCPSSRPCGQSPDCSEPACTVCRISANGSRYCGSACIGYSTCVPLGDHCELSSLCTTP